MTAEELRSDRFGPTVLVHLGSAYNSLNESSLEKVEKFLLNCADQPDAQNLVVDLSSTQYFGSRFIESLFRAHNRMKRKGGRFALAGLQPYPEEIIKISKLDSVWSIFKTPTEAIQTMNAGMPTL